MSLVSKKYLKNSYKIQESIYLTRGAFKEYSKRMMTLGGRNFKTFNKENTESTTNHKLLFNG